MLPFNQYCKSALLLSASVLFVGCESEIQVTKNNAEVIRPVKLLNIGNSEHSRLLSFPAVIQAGRSSNLAFQVSGIVTSIQVNESMEVKKGDVLATLDPRDYQVKVDVAKAQFDKSESEFSRSKGLFKKNIISLIKYESLRAERDVNKANLETAQKSLDDTVLRAPYAGNISKIDLKSNQTVQQGNEVISMLALNKLEAKINLPSSIIAKSQESNTESPVYIVLNAAPEQKIPAFMKEISLEADTDSQTYQATFYFSPQAGLNILPGMNARVFFQDPTKVNSKEIVRIPMSALTKQEEHLFVWVLNEDTMTVFKRVVTIENGVGESLIVKSGLNKGETVITAGVSFLSEGMKVRPWIKN
ncbi:efflux RND transporter periplasmic adaptor subunit [Moritella sp. 24]|uniref:efflux RND transporter periplasmic adaptor subunit n=1 Tax=Moritella sp. 24 TaxID=2746230 RepID=UPI001BA81CB2|nr:efflux RND transporter periplasmic adaptor subunit [Moritella sp. 24]QUM76530.1 efflux RND transporter periplasmic adaptor subunit [Moritella sp. 24]